MAVYTPPTETLPIFDNSAFPSSDGTALTIATGRNYFLTYPVAQGEEIFPSNITLQSSITDSTGSKGLSTQILSSTGTGTQWIYSGLNGYSTYAMSALPFTLPTTVFSNLYVLFTGTGSGTLTIPITGFTTGTLLSIKNISSGTLSISTSTILFSSSTVTTSLIALFSPYTISLYFNGTSWIQTTVSNKMNDLELTGTLTTANLSFTGALATDGITQTAGVSPVELYSTTTTKNIYFGGGLATPQHTTGPIIIGSDSTATGGINIGTGTNQAVPTVNTVNIGSGTYETKIKGTLGITGSTTVESGSNLTLVSGNVSCTAGEIFAPTVRNSANSGSISTAGIITGTSIVSATYGPSANATDVSFCANSTGSINIGTATRTTSGKDINIGNGVNSTQSINIGVTGTTGTTTAIQGNINLGTTSTGKTINLGTATSTTTIDGLLTTDTNTRYSNTTTSSEISEYLSGGLSQITHNNAGDFNLGTTRLNKELNVIFAGSQVQTFTFPSSPQIGQIINLRSGKNGGSITLPAVGSNLFYSSNVNTALVNGSASITLPIISTSSWLYYESNKWLQMNDSLYPLVDTAAGTTGLSIGSTLVNGNIVIGAALGQGDISIGTAQTSSGSITIGSGDSVTSIGGNLTMASNKTIFTTSAQQIRLGYANTQTSGTATSSFGPFFKSFGPASFTGVNYDLPYDGTNGFVPTGTDGWGGILTIYIKTGSGAKIATYIYSVYKRVGTNMFGCIGSIASPALGWTVTPTVSQLSAVDNTLRVTLTAGDVAGATIAWTLTGSI